MENYETLIDTDKEGTYCVLFLNKHSLEREQVEEIFSQFGNVYNIKFHGNRTGHCFVRYKKINEAIRAVENLKHHPAIKLLEHKKKKQKNRSISERSSSSDQGRQECDGTKFIQQFTWNMNRKIDKVGCNENENDKETKHHANFNNHLSWESKCTNGNQRQYDVPGKPNSPSKYKKQNNLLQVPNVPNSYQRNYNGLPELVDQNQESEIPELVTSNGRTSTASSPAKKVILAEEVIVANIHPKFGAPYILHLFDNFEPLAISYIMVEPKYGKRYCCVYFKSAEESEKVETYFDKKLLLDQRLIVIRSSRLVQKAYFK